MLIFHEFSPENTCVRLTAQHTKHSHRFFCFSSEALNMAEDCSLWSLALLPFFYPSSAIGEHIQSTRRYKGREREREREEGWAKNNNKSILPQNTFVCIETIEEWKSAAKERDTNESSTMSNASPSFLVFRIFGITRNSRVRKYFIGSFSLENLWKCREHITKWWNPLTRIERY